VREQSFPFRGGKCVEDVIVARIVLGHGLHVIERRGPAAGTLYSFFCAVQALGDFA
jgi:hypothetical protein